MIFSGNDDNNLSSLWKEYKKAYDADKPQSEMKILETIKEEAKSQRKAWDFYDAGRKYADAAGRWNWKERESARQNFDREIREFDEPVLMFFQYYRNVSGVKYVQEHMDALVKTSNPEFYSVDNNLSSLYYSEAVKESIRNDYEYALLSLSFYGSTVARTLAAQYFAGRYPVEQLLEYNRIGGLENSQRYPALEEFSKQYKDKAVSLLARQDILWNKFDGLMRDQNSTSEQYKALDAEMRQFEAQRKEFSKTEKSLCACCSSVASYLNTLNSLSLDFSIKEDLVSVRFKNVQTAKITVTKDNKKVYQAVLKNPKNSFYIEDKADFRLPDIDDGDYKVTLSATGIEEKDEPVRNYSKHTVSFSTKKDADGYAIYVTDYKSGEPLEKVDLTLYNEAGKTIASYNGLKLLKGYTSLPGEIVSKINFEKNADIIAVSFTDASGRFRSSRQENLPYSYRRYPVRDRLVCRLLCDRTAFNPGETVHFKTILYESGMTSRLLGAGVAHKATLKDAKGKEIASLDLSTSEFGSAHGEFELERRDRNGRYELVIYSDKGAMLTSQSLTVDDFVLPSFTLAWDRQERKYFPGDKITCSGKISSYSGHSLTSSEVTYEVVLGFNEEKYLSGKLQLSPDGRFKIEFASEKVQGWKQYFIKVKVVDSTGETQEFSNTVMVDESFYMSAQVLNSTVANCNLEKEPDQPESNNVSDALLLTDEARVVFNVSNYPSLKLSYRLLKGKSVVAQGTAKAGETVTLDMKDQASGLYFLVASAQVITETGQKFDTEALVRILKVSKDDKSVDVGTKFLYAELPGDDISVLLGTTAGPLWAVAELYDANDKVLEKKLVKLEGQRGSQGSLVRISYPYKDEYTGVVQLRILYFKDSDSWSRSYTVRRPVSRYALPLEFTRFSDDARPHTEYSFLLKTAPGVECAATIYDVSLSRISPNEWNIIQKNEFVPVPRVNFRESAGGASSSFYYDERPRFGILRGAVAKMAGGAVNSVEEESAMLVFEDDALLNSSASKVQEYSDADTQVDVREDFATMICWEPQLLSDSDGNVELKFTTSDKLSTFYVQVFAHDKNLNTKTLRSEMKVSLPVQLSVAPPQYLYEGDSYTLQASLSNTLDKTVSGTVIVQYPGGSKSGKVSIKAGNSLAYSCQIGKFAQGEKDVTVKFIADNKEYGSDAVKFTVPVLKAEQRIVEAHSAVFRAGMDKDAIVRSLRSDFVNASGSDAVLTERTIIDMIRDAVPDKFEPGSDNILTQSESLYAGVLAGSIGSAGLTDGQRAKIIAKIRDCRNDDGGFGWFPGMASSPIITSTLLQRFAGLRDRGLEVKELSDLWPEAAAYIDDAFFEKNGVRPEWCGGLSLGQYMYTRALYSDVEFSKKGTDSKIWKNFVKDAKEYLIPSKNRGLQGQILAKARRLRTLKLLLEKKGGEDLANAWGISFGVKNKLAASVQADVESLLEYAVDHKCGGAYYPNAVLPWRGLQESELYAHSLLCDLMRDCGHDPLADKVRLWIMIQKETQQWYDDPAYIEAISSVLDGSREMKQTTVVVLTADVVKPFAKFKAAGNGMSVSRVFFRNGEQLKDGDVLNVGDRITAQYRIWNEENRSFVKLSVPRPAAFRPVMQLSGHIGWWLRPVSVSGWMSFSPQGYRSVLKESTEYWFDSYPEEKSTISEEFYVTQSGTFQSPVPEIESLYAPHYRANDAGHPAYIVK